MANILFLNPNTDSFGRQSIPTALISGLLKTNEHKVELFDTTFMDIKYLFETKATHEEITSNLHFYKSFDTSGYDLEKQKVDVVNLFEQKIMEFKPDIIAFSLWGSHLHAEGEFHAYFRGLTIIELSDTKDIPIIVGGTVPTWETIETLKHPKINYVIRGESELVYLDIANRIDAGESLSGINNLWIDHGDGNIEQNPLRKLIDPLDVLPHADFDIYDDRSFIRPYHGKMIRILDHELSRGCVYDCTFCLSPFQRKSYDSPKNFRREKSVEKIIDEISYLKQRYKLDMIRYQDETFMLMSLDKLKDLAPKYKDQINLPFIIEANINSVTDEKIRLLKEMGCVNICFGVESGNKDLRDTIIKKPKFTNAQAIEKLKIVKKHGLSMKLFNIFGFPEETEEMILDTIRLNHEIQPPYCAAGYFQPMEGTELRDYAVKNGLLEDSSRGLPNSSAFMLPSKLTNLKISQGDLIHYHDNFSFYVYLSKVYWPLIKYTKRNNSLSRLIKSVLENKLERKLVKVR
jgi:anaerobic magnesium-protoporphyrin IX monomethyl ester cyclase